MIEITTVADDEVVVHDGGVARAYTGLAPGTEHVLDGLTVRTLDRPGGELLCRFATVNDVHFGETLAGVMDGTDFVPISVEPGEDPYPETMNAAAVAEIAAVDPVVLVAKGDLTAHGTRAEYERFLEVYGPPFGDRLKVMPGNHDVTDDGEVLGGDGVPAAVDVPGARLALVDTVDPGRAGGRLAPDQLEFLDDTAADAAADGVPLLVFGHHHCWAPGTERSADYFGITPADSEHLIELVARRPAVKGYFAGHTHRNRVRRFAATGDVPFVEVAAVKDFPGSWAEYRVFEGGVLQIHRRLSTPEALAWSERCRVLYGGLYPEYAFGGLEDRCFALPAN